MGGIIAAVVELLKVRSIITIAIILTMVFMAVRGDIEPATFMTVAGSVVTYYFTRKNVENTESGLSRNGIK